MVLIMGINLIMPMGGSGSRFTERGFDLPKPLIPIHDRPFLFWSTESVRKFVDTRSITFVVLKDHIERFQIDAVIGRFYPDAAIHVLDNVLNGAVLTCLRGVDSVTDDNPVLFNDCDHIFTCKEFYDFCSSRSREDVDGALLTFTSSDPKFSFAQVNQAGHVVKTAEKVVISDKAICGAYYFKNSGIFRRAAEEYLDEPVNKEYYMSGVYNALVRQKAVVRTFTVDMHLPFGTPEEYDFATKSSAFEVLV